MGLIKAIVDSATGMLADSWEEYFYCDALSNDVLMVKGQKKVNEKRGGNKKSSDNVISQGSVVAVNEGQCMIIVEQGKIVDVCAEAGEFVFDNSTEPSLFYGNLAESLGKSFSNFGRRIAFGGNTGKDQRVYYFNTKEIMNNLFGTPTPIPFRVLDKNTGFDFDTAVKVNGQYSFKIVDPILFYINVCGNAADSYGKDEILGTMRSELLTAMQPALAKISAKGVRPYEIPGFSTDICTYLAEELTNQWTSLRGIQMIKMSINAADMPAEDRERFQKWQDTAMLRNSNMAAARQTEAFSNMMENSGKSGGSGMDNVASMAAMSMMSQMMGGNFFGNNGANQAQAPQMQAAGAAAGWTCSCGAVNKGKFCSECGAKKPAGAPLYKCDKCGWEPEDPTHPPKFCPECGDVFDENDRA